MEAINPSNALPALASLGKAAGIWLCLWGVLVVLFSRSAPRVSGLLGFLALLSALLLQKMLGASASGNQWYFLLAALAGLGLPLWILLTLLYRTKPTKDSTSLDLLSLAAACWFVFDLSATLPHLFGFAPGGLLELLLLVALLIPAIYWLYPPRPWFQLLVLAFVGSRLSVAGVFLLLDKPIPLVHSTPLLHLTALALAAFLAYLFAFHPKYQPTSPDLIERYKPYAGVAGTHLFLVLFTLLTLYPVLWVVKMAMTPQQGFSMGLSPVPTTLTNYFAARRKGDKKVASCYLHSMSQNLREVIGAGGTCRDQICQAFAAHHDKRILAYRSICPALYAAWKLAPPQKKQARQKYNTALLRWKKAPPDQRGASPKLATFEAPLRQQNLDRWFHSSLALEATPGPRRKRLRTLLTSIREEHHDRLKRRYVFFRQLLNSIIVALVTTLLGVFLACTAAYAFSRFRFPGRRAGLMSFLVSQMFPGTLMMIPLYILISRLGLLNSLIGLTLVYSTTSIPFCVWMLKGYFDTIPKELEESALIDGASRLMIFWKIMLPLARPAIAVTALFSFMTAWNEFILAATFMNEETSYTLPVMLQRYVGAHNTEWGHFAAGAIIISIPIVTLFFLLQKNLVGGLTAGSVKG